MKNLLILVLVAISGIFTSCSNEPVYSLSISKHAVVFPVGGGDEIIKVQANDPWDVVVQEEDKTWITVTPEHSEYIHADLVINTKINNTGTERVSDILIVNGNATRVVKVTQEYLVVAPEKVVGAWEMTECDSKGMIGSKFVFNADLSCTATMPMMGNRPINATYTLIGNVINILVGPKTIDIAVKSIDSDNMSAVVMGDYDSALKKIK